MTRLDVPRQKSTIVRTIRSMRSALLRRCFRTLEALAPDAGARLALRLWCSPPRRPRQAGAPPLGRQPGGANTFTGPFDGAASPVAVNGGTVLTRGWGSGPTVYLVHGWGGWGDQLHGLVAPLVLAGYRVISFDAPSHGRSEPGRLGPGRTTLSEFADALAAVVRATGPAHAIVGHSLGGTAAGLGVLDGLRTNRLVLVGAMADPLPYIGTFRRTLRVGPSVGDRFVRLLEELVGRPMADFDIAARAAQAHGLPPVLVVQDAEDRDVDPRDGATLAAAWSGALHRTTGLGHRRILRDRQVIDRVVRFVADQTPTDQPPAGEATPRPRSAHPHAARGQLRPRETPRVRA